MTWEQALLEGKAMGASRCSDAAAMALFCNAIIQILVGAVSPRLVWEGAMKQGMTLRDLATLANSDPVAVGDLMWA